MGVPLSGHAYVFGNNKGMVKGASIIEWKLTKKNLGIFHNTENE